jgi:hypothetical protein
VIISASVESTTETPVLSGSVTLLLSEAVKLPPDGSKINGELAGSPLTVDAEEIYPVRSTEVVAWGSRSPFPLKVELMSGMVDSEL